MELRGDVEGDSIWPLRLHDPPVLLEDHVLEFPDRRSVLVEIVVPSNEEEARTTV